MLSGTGGGLLGWSAGMITGGLLDLLPDYRRRPNPGGDGGGHAVTCWGARSPGRLHGILVPVEMRGLP